MNTNKKEKLPFEELMGKLKAEDANYAAISKRFQYIYLVFIIFYVVVAVLGYIFEGGATRLLSDISFVISFLILAVIFRKYHKEYKFVDYSLPTLQLLKKAEYRYKPFRIRSVWVLFALGFMDVALTLHMVPAVSVWTVQIVILSTILVAVVIGLIHWRNKYKPLLDNVRHLISEIETD